MSAPLGMYSISSNVDAVTWVGDLGSILAEVAFQCLKLGRPHNDPEVQAQVDLMAPVQGYARERRRLLDRVLYDYRRQRTAVRLWPP